MTDLKPEDLVKLRKIAATRYGDGTDLEPDYPVGLGLEVRHVAAAVAAIDSLLADRARMEKALVTCRDVIVNLGVYFPEGSMGRADAELGVEAARQALGASQ